MAKNSKKTPAKGEAAESAPKTRNSPGRGSGLGPWEEIKRTWEWNAKDEGHDYLPARVTRHTNPNNPKHPEGFFAFRRGKYLGLEYTLDEAQARAERNEQQPRNHEHVIEEGGLPAFLALTKEERRATRGTLPPGAAPEQRGPAPQRKADAPAAPAEDAAKKAEALRAELRADRSGGGGDAKARAPRGAEKELDKTAVITMISSENPKRKGTGAHDRFALLMQHAGKTVGEFLAAGGNPKTLTNAIAQKRARL